VETGSEYSIYLQAVNLAKVRLEAVKITFEQGDKPAIDTLEAFIQWQDRQVQANKAYVKFQKSTLELSNFLWNNNQPLQLQSNVQPPILSSFQEVKNWNADTVVSQIQSLNIVHPDLLLYDLKLKNLDVERRWKQEKLKPKLNINYNFLLEPIGGDEASDVSLNNFKWGLNFKYPIPNRTARAELQLNAIKVQETQLNRIQKQQELTNKAQYYYVQVNNLLEQIGLSNDNINNYQRLLNAERQKFDIGESSLFLVNSRENKLISAQLKLLELKAKFQMSRMAMDWALGRLE
jgi:outer membrane protein TolC